MPEANPKCDSCGTETVPFADDGRVRTYYCMQCNVETNNRGIAIWSLSSIPDPALVEEEGPPDVISTEDLLMEEEVGSRDDS
jgi:uncharacterized OB-fold protein